MTEIGTLEELNVKRGDVVNRDVSNGEEWIIKFTELDEFLGVKPHYKENHKGIKLGKSYKDWTIVSRASDNPRSWKELTDQEQGALLLAHHRGEVIEYLSAIDGWCPTIANRPSWQLHTRYRVKPKDIIDTITFFGRELEYCDGLVLRSDCRYNKDTISATLPTKNGELMTGVFANEDGYTVKVEKLTKEESSKNV